MSAGRFLELLERMDRKQMSMKPDQVVIMVEVKAVGVGTMAVEDMAEVVMVEDVEKEAMVEGGMGMTVMVMTAAVEEVATVSVGRFL